MMPTLRSTVTFLAITSLALGTTLFAVQDNRNLPTDVTPTENDPLTDGDWEDDFVDPSKIAREAFGDPPRAKRLGKQNLWVDRNRQRVYFDGYVTMRDGPLEMLACPAGSKEHESVIATLPRSSQVHAALLSVGAKPGTPVAFLPKFVPPTGQRIRIWICYRDPQGKFQVADARRWIQDGRTKQHLEEDWVFGGSSFWKDPRNGREYYQADGGDMICVSNFSTAMMDLPMLSSAEAAQLVYEPFTSRIPERGVPVRVILTPIPLPKDKPENPRRNAGDPDQPPTESVLPVKK